MREIRTLRCDVEGTGNVAWSRYCDTRRRKSELTVNTNFDLNRRASPRPYLREAGGAIPSAYSPNLRKTAPQRRFMPKLPIRHPQARRRRSRGMGLINPSQPVASARGGIVAIGGTEGDGLV
jgi:hypothetical protein